MDFCQLSDLELHGYPFTWERGGGSVQMIEARLDRAMVSMSWRDCFPDAELHNLGFSSSDHGPLYLSLDVSNSSVSLPKFRFENAWLKEPVVDRLLRVNGVVFMVLL